MCLPTSRHASRKGAACLCCAPSHPLLPQVRHCLHMCLRFQFAIGTARFPRAEKGFRESLWAGLIPRAAVTELLYGCFCELESSAAGLTACWVTKSAAWWRDGGTKSCEVSQALATAGIQRLLLFVFLQSAFNAQYCHFARTSHSICT